MPTPASDGCTPPSDSRFSNVLGEAARDPKIHRAIDYRTQRLCRAFGLGRDAADDLRQDAWLRICRAFARFDPSRSSPRTFATRVADRWYAETARGLRAKRRHPRTAGVAESCQLHDPSRQDPVAEHGERLDAREAISRLNADQLEAARCVCAGTVVRTADGLGLHRATIYRRLADARVEIAAFRPGSLAEPPSSHRPVHTTLAGSNQSGVFR